jgi:hypothetical protein
LCERRHHATCTGPAVAVAQEVSGLLQIEAVRGPFSARVSGVGLNFDVDTAPGTGAPRLRLSGASAVKVRLAWEVPTGDAVVFRGQSASFPASLAASEAAAIGLVATGGTAFDATLLGSAPSAGFSYVLDRRLGSSAFRSTLTAGVDYEPRPRAGSTVLWRGTTMRGVLDIERTAARLKILGAVSASRSVTDSLDGTNLFTGGGEIGGELGLAAFVRADSSVRLDLLVGHSRPYSQTAREVPTRAIPIGRATTARLAATMTRGAWAVEPEIVLFRATSDALRNTGARLPVRVNASTSTATAALRVVVPVATRTIIEPEFGMVAGRVTQVVSGVAAPAFRRPAGRAGSFDDRVSGWYSALTATIELP